MPISVVFTIGMLFFGGMIACYGLIIAQAPDIKEKFDLVIPFQGFIGAILLIMGIRELFRLGVIISLLGSAPFWGIIGLLILLSEFVLGFILSYGLITKMMTSHQQAADKVSGAYNTLVIVQVPFGLLAMLLALVLLVVNLIY